MGYPAVIKKPKAVPGMRSEFNPAAFARLDEPVDYTARCFVADCPIGNLAADALCKWSEYMYADGGLGVCIVPTRALGGGLGPGGLDLETVGLAMPREAVVTLELTVASLVEALGARAKAAWERCLTDHESITLQSSGMQITRRCDPPEPSRPAMRLVLARDGALVDADGETRIHVVTVESALAMLPVPAEPPIERTITIQEVFVDYMRHHSPLNYSVAAPGDMQWADRRRPPGARILAEPQQRRCGLPATPWTAGLATRKPLAGRGRGRHEPSSLPLVPLQAAARHKHPRVQHELSCGDPACGPLRDLNVPLRRVSSRVGAQEGLATWQVLSAALFAAALVVGCVVWRRRRARRELASPPTSARGERVQAAVPDLAAYAAPVHERVPLKTGGARLTSSDQLGA